jgi:DUF4097 and DUF4098 domain-containing protein YvlB
MLPANDSHDRFKETEMKTLAIALVAAAALLALPASVRPQDPPIVSESDHDLEEGAAVSVDSVIGAIRIRTGDHPKAHLKTVKRGRDAEHVTFHVESSPKRLQVETRFSQKRNDVSIEIELVLPKAALASLSASTVSGSLELQDLESRSTELKGTSGRIRVNGLRGDLALRSISGSVDLAGLSGSKAGITLTSGSLRGSGELKSLQVESVSGSVTFDLVPPKEGGWSAKASLISGSVALRVTGTSGGALDLSSLSGKVSSGLPLRDREDRGRGVNRSLRGVFGKGAGVVHVTTVSGDVRVDPLD